MVTSAPLGFDEILNTVKSGFANVVKVVDFGIDVYASVPGRVEALKEISREVNSSVTEPAQEKPVDHAAEFFKNNSGAFTVGAIALLVLVAVRN